MHIVCHRVNSVAAISRADRAFGAEIDVRYHGGELILHHDAFHHDSGHHDSGHHGEGGLRLEPDRLEEWLTHFRSAAPLILNVKSEGIEARCIELMLRHEIRNWFFLDLSFPMLASLARRARQGLLPGLGAQHFAARFSDLETVESAMALRGLAGWVWVDFFERPYPPRDALRKLKEHFQICVVSPELHADSEVDFAQFSAFYASVGVHAVCTKRPHCWQAALSGAGATD